MCSGGARRCPPTLEGRGGRWKGQGVSDPELSEGPCPVFMPTAHLTARLLRLHDLRGSSPTPLVSQPACCYLFSLYVHPHTCIYTSHAHSQTSSESSRGFIAKVSDFGLARLLGPSEDELIVSRIGTVSHMVRGALIVPIYRFLGSDILESKEPCKRKQAPMDAAGRDGDLRRTNCGAFSRVYCFSIAVVVTE